MSFSPRYDEVSEQADGQVWGREANQLISWRDEVRWTSHDLSVAWESEVSPQRRRDERAVLQRSTLAFDHFADNLCLPNNAQVRLRVNAS